MRLYLDQARIDSYDSLPALINYLIRPLADFDGEVVTPVPLEQLNIFGDSLLNYLDYTPVNVLDTEEGFATQVTKSVRLRTLIDKLPCNPAPEAPVVDWLSHLNRVANANESYTVGKLNKNNESQTFSWEVAGTKKHATRFFLLVDPYMFSKSSAEDSADRLTSMLRALIQPITNERLQLVLMYRWDTVGRKPTRHNIIDEYDRPANSKLWRYLKNAVRRVYTVADLVFINVCYSPNERTHDRYGISQQYLFDGGAAILQRHDAPHLSRLRISYHSGRLRKCPDVSRRIEEFEHVLNRYALVTSKGAPAADYIAMSSVTDLMRIVNDWRKLLGLGSVLCVLLSYT